MFGLGDIFVEVLKEVSSRVVPVKRRDALEMIKETKGYQLLEGYRGEEPASILALIEMILRISDSTNKNPHIRQIELNPVFAYKNKALARDARMILEGN